MLFKPLMSVAKIFQEGCGCTLVPRCNTGTRRFVLLLLMRWRFNERELDTNYLDLPFRLPPTLCKPGEEHDVLNRRNLRKIYKAFEIRTTCIFHVKY